MTVFEGQPVAGGIPRLHIPEYRLPVSVVAREVEQIVSLGIEIKVNSPIDSQVFMQITKNYNACFIATGAPLSQKLGVPGEELSGVLNALGFLRRQAGRRRQGREESCHHRRRQRSDGLGTPG